MSEAQLGEIVPLDTLALLGLDNEEYEEIDAQQKALASDEASDMSSGESFEEGSTISMAKMRYAQVLQQELERDVAQGLLISKEQYDHLRFEDEKVMHLRNAKVNHQIIALLLTLYEILQYPVSIMILRTFGSCT